MGEEVREGAATRREWVGLGVLSLGLSMVVLDGTIVSVSLPVIIEDLGLGFTQAQWVNSVYSVVLAALLVTCGRLGDRLGRRRLFAVGVVLFVVGSVLAASAGAAGSLIAARVVQGLGGACILPGTLSTVNATFRGRDRVMAFAVWGSVISGMAAVGPLLGGWLTTSFTWPWIFLVNVPVGLLLLVGIFLFVPETRGEIRAPGLDVGGFLLSAAGFAVLVFALIEGQTYGWWKPLKDLSLFGVVWPETAPVSAIPVLLALGLALLVFFCLWERRRARTGRSALLDLGLFGLPSFRWGNLAAFAVALGEFGLLFVLPLYLVNVLALSTLQSGLVLATMALGAFLAGGAAEGLVRRMGPPRIVTLGLAIEATAIVLVASVVTPHTSPWLLALLLAGYGIGLGLASAQLTGTVLADVRPADSGQGSATQSTVRQLGSALGAAVLGGLLSLSLGSTLPAALDDVPGLAPQAAAQATEATRASAGGTIAQLRTDPPQGATDPDAVADALADGFAAATRTTLFAAAGCMLLGLAAATRIPRGGRREAPGRAVSTGAAAHDDPPAAVGRGEQ
ncbi:MFS transporter [Streptomyces sp. NPDC094032]|uniref:MFS transporter n=1 Tax=Streptomyces sp. NPDC094032 TaxID=3155308 RepID=UPI0033298EAC